MYGAIERIRIVKDKKGKSKSYAFIVFDRERDMKGESGVDCRERVEMKDALPFR